MIIWYSSFRLLDGFVLGRFGLNSPDNEWEHAVDTNYYGAVISLNQDDESTVPDYAVYYVPDPLNPICTERPISVTTLDKQSINADGIDAATLSNIPVSTVITITDLNGANEYTVVDGVFEITSDVAGEISYKVEYFPQLDFEGVITAT